MDSIARLLEVGYSFSLDNDKIKFHYERSGEPPEEFRGILTEIKTHKEEALILLRSIAREPEPLPLEKPVQLSQVPVADPVKNDEMALGIGSETQGSLPFIQAGGEAKKVKMAPVKIFSKLFNEEIWLVTDQKEMEALVSKGVREVIYMAWEIPVLRGVGQEKLKTIHQIKKIFPGSAMA